MIGLKGIPFPAGIENFTEQVATRLVERGHRVTVYVRPYVRVGDEYRGARIRHLPSINTKHLDAVSHTLLATLDVLFADLDVVHYHALGPSVFSLLPRLCGVPTVVHVHGLDWQRAKWSFWASRCLRAAEYSAVFFPHRTVTISRTLQRYFVDKYRRSVEYIPTGVSAGEYREPREIRTWGLGREDYVLFLARLVPEKGAHYLLDAFRQLPDTKGKRLVIAGGASHSADYEQGLARFRGPDVIFTGEVTGRIVQELFANAYAYVLPSDVEGLPVSLLEALSHGRCAVASDIDPNVEALGGCGLTFRAGDVGDLRDKLQYVLDTPDFVARCAASGVARVRTDYSWEHVVDQLEHLYASVAVRTPRPVPH